MADLIELDKSIDWVALVVHRDRAYLHLQQYARFDKYTPVGNVPIRHEDIPTFVKWLLDHNYELSIPRSPSRTESPFGYIEIYRLKEDQ